MPKTLPVLEEVRQSLLKNNALSPSQKILDKLRKWIKDGGKLGL
jgi:hypothetical protein